MILALALAAPGCGFAAAPQGAAEGPATTAPAGPAPAAPSGSLTGEAAAGEAGLEPVSLPFEPVTPESLEPGRPGDDLVPVEVIPLQVSGRSVAVHFFSSRTYPQEISAFLADGDTWFSLGPVSYYGDAEASAQDWTGDGVPELTVSGGLGATSVGTKIIGYDDTRGAWTVWLAAGQPQVVQREPDGRPVLIEGSRGSLPPFVHIYRWHGAGFERADVAAALDMDYAVLHYETGLIEVGHWDGTAPEPAKPEPVRYRYDDGRLLPVTGSEAGQASPGGTGAANAGDACRVTLHAPTGASLDVEVAADPEARRKGLSGRDALPPGTAMALAFPEPVTVTIWMKDMRFDLDAVWIDGDRVVDVRRDIPAPEPGTPDEELPTYRGRAPADVVLELPAGTAAALGLRTGSSVRWEPAPPATACSAR